MDKAIRLDIFQQWYGWLVVKIVLAYGKCLGNSNLFNLTAKFDQKLKVSNERVNTES